MSDPADQIVAGRRVVGLLREQGCDLSAERLVSHVFIGVEQPLGDLARDLFIAGYRVLRATEDSCIAEAMCVVDEAWVEQITPEMTARAAAHGLQYDGWEAAADPTLQ